MQPDKLQSLWSAYRTKQVNMTIHPKDHMFLSGGKGVVEYNFVGESAISVLSAILTLAPAEAAWRVLDFGCGHGRCARHFRAFFPTAQLFFSDVDAEAAKFCAAEFGGNAVVSSADLDNVELPSDLDLIWVGSLFTHIDYTRMQQLFGKLWASLRRHGTLVGTFHGRRAHAVGSTSRFITEDRWEKIVAGYEKSQCGFECYPGREADSYGVSLIKPEKVLSLGASVRDARLICFSEHAWAGLQDVAAWSRT